MKQIQNKYYEKSFQASKVPPDIFFFILMALQDSLMQIIEKRQKIKANH